MKLAFTVFTSPKVLTKSIEVDNDVLVKTAPTSWVSHAEYVEAHSLAEVMARLDSLTENQAVGWGIYNKLESTPIVVNDQRQPGEVSRTTEFFAWPGCGGVVMLDVDVEHDPHTAYDAICKAYFVATGQRLDHVEMYYRPSSSSGVHLPGKPPKFGGRFYFAIEKGSDIPHVGKAIYTGLWLTGHGYIHITKSAQPGDRALIDKTVWSQERIDYVYPAILGPGVERVEPPRHIWNAGTNRMLTRENTSVQLGTLGPNQADAFKVAVARAKEEAAPRIREVHAAYQDSYVAKHGEGTASAAFDATMHHSLSAKFTIELANGECVSVAAILANKAKYHNVLCCDPLEPSRDGRSTYGKARIYTNRRPMIRSFLHGTLTYALCLQTRKLQQPLPFNPADAVRDLSRQIKEAFPDEVFITQDGKLRRIDNLGRPQPFPQEQFAVVLGDRIQQTQLKDDVLKQVRLHKSVIRDFFAMLGSEFIDLPLLRNGTNKPYLVPQLKTFVTEPGYDIGTKLYLSVEHEFPPVQALNVTQRTALRNDLLEAFNGFSFIPPDSGVDKAHYTRAMCFALILMTALRRTVATPAVMPSGSAPGIGKTELCRCLISSLGCAFRSTKHDRKNDEENKKTFAAIALDPDEYINLDNADGVFLQSVVEQMADKKVDEPTDIRLLNVNSLVQIFNDMLLLINGINTRPGSLAMARRVLKLDLEPIAIWKTALKTAPDPSGTILANWQVRHMHVLSLVADYIARGMPRVFEGRELPRDFNAYYDFDAFVRGFVWSEFGIDVAASIITEAEDIAEGDDVDGAAGRALTACWLYAVANAGSAEKRPAATFFVEHQTKGTPSGVSFVMPSVKRWLGNFEYDPTGVVSKMLSSPKTLMNMGLVNGLQLHKVSGKDVNQRHAMWKIDGCPLEISSLLKL